MSISKVTVTCGICSRIADTAIWGALSSVSSQKGWMCQSCYNQLWNVLNENE